MTGDRLLLTPEERVARYEARRTVHWRYWNLVTAIRRRERRLVRSMAHTPKPRPGDVIRWRKMRSEIEEIRAKADALNPGQTAHKTGGGDAPT